MIDIGCNQWLALDATEPRSLYLIHILQSYICMQPCHERAIVLYAEPDIARVFPLPCSLPPYSPRLHYTF